MEDLVQGGLGQLEAHEDDEHGHRQTGQVLQTAMAEGVLPVRLLAAQLEAQQRHGGGAGVGQVVEGVRRDGDGAGDLSGEEFAQEQQDVQTDAHRAAQDAVGLPDGGGFGVSAVPDENTG